jgi:hypothetical protein
MFLKSINSPTGKNWHFTEEQKRCWVESMNRRRRRRRAFFYDETLASSWVLLFV